MFTKKSKFKLFQIVFVAHDSICDCFFFNQKHKSLIYKVIKVYYKQNQNPQTKRTCYTHQRTRSAMKSIEFYLPYLFTFQHVDGMPNTNNKIEGTFTDLKKNHNNHSGMKKGNRKRFINGFFLALNGD